MAGWKTYCKTTLETKIEIIFENVMCQCAKTDVMSFDSWSQDCFLMRYLVK